MKIYAVKTVYEPPHQDTRWGSCCIEVSSVQFKKSIEVPRSVLSDLDEKDEKKVRSGGVVRFFPDDIGYRELRPLFE